MDEIKRQGDLNSAFLAGCKMPGVKFRHNSVVKFESSENGERLQGWIVSVNPLEPEPIYTIERCDGGGDEEVVESKIELILDPHEPA